MTEYVSQQLVNAFVASAANHFQSLERRYHLACSLEAEVFGLRRMKSVRPEQVGDCFFWLKLKLAGPAFSVVISYGDREHDRNCHIHRKDSRAWAEREHVRLAAEADEAFRRKDYKAVVEALSAVRVELMASERAKLTYARKKLER